MGFFSDVIKVGTLGLVDLDPDAPQVPGLGRTGQAIQQEQLAQLQRGGELQQELQPFQLAQLGFTRDAEGNLRQMTPEEQQAQASPLQAGTQDAQSLLQQRFLSALRGETPASAGLERDIARQRGLLGEDIARRGQMGGTAEAQRTGAFTEAALVSREQARNQQISQAGQQFQQLQTGQQNLLAQRLAQLRGEPTSVLPFVQAGGQALQPSLLQQQLGFQSNLAQTQARQQTLSDVGQFAGSFFGGGS